MQQSDQVCNDLLQYSRYTISSKPLLNVLVFLRLLKLASIQTTLGFSYPSILRHFQVHLHFNQVNLPLALFHTGRSKQYQMLGGLIYVF